MNEQFSQDILKRIESERITPLPRWRFLVLQGVFWLLAASSVVIGGFAVASILFLLFDLNRHGLWDAPHDIVDFFIFIPYVWIVVLALFTLIARVSLRHAGNGYRYPLGIVVTAAVLFSVILGAILNNLNIGKMTHEAMNRMPFYDEATFDARDAWNRPSVGRLAGIVVFIKSHNDFSVIDFGGHLWAVHIASSTGDMFIPEASSTIRMSGELEPASHTFIAHSVHEWEKEP